MYRILKPLKKGIKKTGIELKKIDSIFFLNNEFDNEFKKLLSKRKIQYLQISNTFQPEKDNTYFYKYLDLESVLLSFRNGSIRFVEPTRWEDKFEGRFYNARYTNVSTNPQDSPFLYASCMSIKPHNEAAWKVYSYGKLGIGAHCVQIKINRNQFRKELIQSKTINSKTKIYEGLVTYATEPQICGIHKRTYKNKTGAIVPNPRYNNFFSYFSRTSYLNLLLLKRDYFRHENEVRFFVVPDVAPGPKGKRTRLNGSDVFGSDINISMDWANVIEEIRIDSKCTELEYNIFKDECIKLLKASNRYTICKTRAQKSKLEKKFTPIKTDIYGKRRSVTIE